VVWACVIALFAGGHLALHAAWPNPGTSAGSRRGAGWIAGVSLGAATVLLAARYGPGAGVSLALTLVMLATSLVALLGPLSRPPEAKRRLGDRRRASLRHDWRRGEAWGKVTAGLVGGFLFFAAASLWLPTVLPRWGLSIETALALAVLLTVPAWAALIFVTLLARSGRRAWGLTAGLLAFLGLSAALPRL
jgi:hypothetical protein